MSHVASTPQLASLSDVKNLVENRVPGHFTAGAEGSRRQVDVSLDLFARRKHTHER